MPAVTMAFSMRGMVKGLDLGGTGLSIATVLLPGSLGLALFFSVYSNLVGVYVTRRESLVLKRLRTGEVRDWEIFAGGALPALMLALVQCVLLIVGLTVVLDAPAPAAPAPGGLGLLAGVAMLVAAGGADGRGHPDRRERAADLPAVLAGEHGRLRDVRTAWGAAGHGRGHQRLAAVLAGDGPPPGRLDGRARRPGPEPAAARRPGVDRCGGSRSAAVVPLGAARLTARPEHGGARTRKLGTMSTMSVEDWVERLGGGDGPSRYRRYAVSSVGSMSVFEAGLWTFWVGGVTSARWCRLP